MPLQYPKSQSHNQSATEKVRLYVLANGNVKQGPNIAADAFYMSTQSDVVGKAQLVALVWVLNYLPVDGLLMWKVVEQQFVDALQILEFPLEEPELRKLTTFDFRCTEAHSEPATRSHVPLLFCCIVLYSYQALIVYKRRYVNIFLLSHKSSRQYTPKFAQYNNVTISKPKHKIITPVL